MSSSQVEAINEQIASVTSKVRTYLSTLPLVTIGMSVTTTVTFFLSMTSILNYGDWELSPLSVGSGRVYVLFLYPFVHFNFFHLFIDLLGFIPCSAQLEKRLGSFQHFFLLILPFTLLPGLLYCVVVFGLDSLGAIHSTNYFYGGMSGWILSLLVPIFLTPEQTSFSFSNPTFRLSLLFLLILQLLSPLSAILLHLCAISAGYLYTYKYIDRMLPPTSFYTRLEQNSFLSRIGSWRGFVSRDASGYLPLGQEEEGVGASRDTRFPGAGHRLGS